MLIGAVELLDCFLSSPGRPYDTQGLLQLRKCPDANIA
jgi:hypothetical protein